MSLNGTQGSGMRYRYKKKIKGKTCPHFTGEVCHFVSFDFANFIFMLKVLSRRTITPERTLSNVLSNIRRELDRT